MDNFSICMITYNKSPFLQVSIPAIASTIFDWSNVEFLILDNGSTDSTPEVLRCLSELFPIQIYSTDENIGLNGYSVITAMSDGDIIITVDDDIFYVSDDWQYRFIDILHNYRYNNMPFGYIGSLPINVDSGYIKGEDIDWVYDDNLIEICPVGGWFAATTRDVMESVGGFHNDEKKMYLEDAHYQRASWAAGYACGISHDVKVVHACSPVFYKALNRYDTFIEKAKMAKSAGIEIDF